MYEKFEQLMREKGVTPADVSKATGIGKSSLTGWKNGSYTPKADKLYAISKYFGVPMDFFFDEEAANRIAEMLAITRKASF